MDIRRGKIDLLKATNQNRARQTVVLVRLDLGEHLIAILMEKKLLVLIFISIERVMELNGQNPFHRMNFQMQVTYG